MSAPDAATLEAAAVLARLAEARTVTIRVRTETGGGSGEGSVEVARLGDAVELAETGSWALGDGRPMRWRAVSRWRAEGAALAVEHVRQGTPARAVLDRAPDGRWRARADHVCGQDLYRAALDVSDDAVTVTWTIRGPCKQAQITTRYEVG